MKRSYQVHWDVVFGGMIVLLLLYGVFTYQRSRAIQHELAALTPVQIVDLEAAFLSDQLVRLQEELTLPRDPVALHHSGEHLQRAVVMLRRYPRKPRRPASGG
ncbi:MAG: hypothetical protein HC876_23360 [Chloroflexaceae bacterium]|nr:hypothetical protein [Chloroflexaceae bacterium]